MCGCKVYCVFISSVFGQAYLALQSDPSIKLRSEQHVKIKKIHISLQVHKCFLYPSIVSQNSRSGELFHHLNEILFHATKIICLCNNFSPICIKWKIVHFTSCSKCQELLGINGYCSQVLKSVRNSTECDGMVMQSPTYEQGLYTSCFRHN